MQHPDHSLDAALLGKIMFARFLALPLRKFDRLVCRTESSAGFSALRTLVTVGQVGGTQVRLEADNSLAAQSATALGEVRIGESDELIFLYYYRSYVREYRFDENGVTDLLSGAHFPAELASVLRRLRLVNTRNRLIQALMQEVLASQAPYLRSGQVLMLLPLTQAALSARLRVDVGSCRGGG